MVGCKPAFGLFATEDGARDELSHDLGSAAVDGLDPGVDIETRNRILSGVAITPEQLKALIGDIALHFAAG